jgi:hypothetical protein
MDMSLTWLLVVDDLLEHLGHCSEDRALEGWYAQQARKARRIQVVNAAFDTPDILECILRGNVGPSVLADCTAVSRRWRRACREDASVVRAVALYQGGLTKEKLVHFFHITKEEASQLAHTVHDRGRGGRYLLYGSLAVDALLSGDGLAAWHRRMQTRAKSPIQYPPPRPKTQIAAFQEEDNLHARHHGLPEPYTFRGRYALQPGRAI